MENSAEINLRGLGGRLTNDFLLAGQNNRVRQPERETAAFVQTNQVGGIGALGVGVTGRIPFGE